MNVDAPFKDVSEALRHAFLFESKIIIGVTQYADGSIRGTDGHSVWDDYAQAGLTLQLARRTLKKPENRFMLANFTKPVSGLLRKKEQYCKELSFDVCKQVNGITDRWFVNDVVRSYCGLMRHHTDLWWAGHLGISDRQVRNYKNGRDGKPGIIAVCDQLHERMVQQLNNVFYASNLTQYDN